MTDIRDRRLVLLHGFTQTGRSWKPIIERLAAGDVRTPDLPGHGSAAAERLGLWDAAAWLARREGHGVWVGYSLGGRHALHVALAHPGVVDGLVLLGATAGIDDPAERAGRRVRDEELADSILAEGVDAFLRRWLAQPLFAGLDPDRAQLDDRRRNHPAGLAASLRLAGTGTQDPLWDRLPELGRAGCPVLVLAGEHDTKFRAHGERLAATIGSTARFETVAAAGHTAHLEQPDRFAAQLERWLAEIGRSGGDRES